ncbi:MAG: hypothetical protein WC846_02220 [Candidatus Gracilibacteria bacterium]|jgi:hypothetical protein
MKIRKTLIAASLCLCLFSSLFLTSCGQEEDDLSNPLTRTDETHIGTFMPLGSIKIHSSVTHLFETDDGDVLYAFSDRYDLDSSEYAGVRVEAYGTVSTYESLDKPLYEVKRITDAPAIDAPEEVTSVEYKNTTIGVSFTYPSNWKMEEKLNMISLAEPEKKVENGDTLPLDEAETEHTVKAITGETGTPDSIWAVKIEAGLTKTSTDENGLRSEEIATYVKSEYADLTALTGDLTYVGADEQFSLRYKTENGDIYYFIPRETSLYELSYQHTNKDDSLLLDNTNVFSNLVATFRFLPKDGETTEVIPGTSADAQADAVPMTEGPSVSQVEISKFAPLTSNLGFSMSYPASWYYLGSNAKYIFTDQKIDFATATVDNTTPVLTLTWSSIEETGMSTTGTMRNGDNVSVTFIATPMLSFGTLTGDAKYEELMQKMADSYADVRE